MITMKKLAYYILIIFLVVIVLPSIIVKGCHSDNKSNIDNSDYDYVKTPDNKKEGWKISVYMSQEEKVVEMDFEEYVKGVVAAEMPANFEIEALKAQAVAARTYALAKINKINSGSEDKHQGADICTNPGHCQAFISKKDAMNKWSLFSSKKNWSKISSAVDSTQGQVITYDGKIINAVFHSNSGGKTEDSEDVWDGVVVPYLKSVDSAGEDNCEEYKTTVSFKADEFRKKLTGEYPEIEFESKSIIDDMEILDYTKGGRVKNLKIGNIYMKGTDFRSLFSLRSAKFTIKEEKGKISITTLGNGHGVGMSQWGANYMAKTGKKFTEIIKYYYKGVELSAVDNVNNSKAP